MNSWLVWLVSVTASALLAFVAYHFTVRTLRFVTAALAAAVVVLVTRFGVAHPASGHTDLVNSFTRGFGDLSVAFFQPGMPAHHIPAPGRYGWLIICGVLIFGYRELEVWAMHCQPPTVDTSALKGEKKSRKTSGTPGEPLTHLQRNDELVRELTFRLPAVEVRAPAILPGGTRASGLASIAEHSGVTGSGLASAIVEFFGMLWPNPRRYQVHVWLEPDEKAELGGKEASACTRVTVDIEDRSNGETIATQTLAASGFEQAAEVVAGYVAWSIFKDDPTTPSWCYGAADGEDIVALLLTREQRVISSSPEDVQSVRRKQIKILKEYRLQSGVSRYELAQLYDLERHHVKALRLHARNREDYPRFFRGRYRLAMSLEMVAHLDFAELGSHTADTLREALCILDRCEVTLPPDGRRDDGYLQRLFESCRAIDRSVNEHERALKLALLTAAQSELREIRKQLVLWRLILASLRHRDERTIWTQYLGLTTRQRFHDGARVAELYITVRRCIANRENTNGSTTNSSRRIGVITPFTVLKAVRTLRIDFNTRRALRIVEAVAGEPLEIRALLKNRKMPTSAARRRTPGKRASRTRWLPWLHRTPSSQAAYNTACMYGAVFEHSTKPTSPKEYSEKDIASLAVRSLSRAFIPQDSEMQRPSDWIDVDPDFTALKESSPEFRTFLKDHTKRDYPSAPRSKLTVSALVATNGAIHAQARGALALSNQSSA